MPQEKKTKKKCCQKFEKKGKRCKNCPDGGSDKDKRKLDKKKK